MSVQDSTRRFSSRVGNYVLYRPGYPKQVVELLETECELTADSAIADIASGTGIFTRLLLENGHHVFGVEPNAEMRLAEEKYLAAFPRFCSVTGTAEATTLAAQSIDIVTAAQAAHWFDRDKARREFARILRPGGWCVLVWNERQVNSTPFLRAYEHLLQTYATDYHDVRHELTTARIDEFFAPSSFREKTFASRQEFDYPALEGRLLSSSYAPQTGDPKHEPMMRTLREIFDAHQISGTVAFEYDTRVFYGKLD